MIPSWAKTMTKEQLAQGWIDANGKAFEYERRINWAFQYATDMLPREDMLRADVQQICNILKGKGS